MSPENQTVIAVGIVVVTVAALLWSVFRKKKGSSCGGGTCGAVSPEIKKLQRKLRR